MAKKFSIEVDINPIVNEEFINKMESLISELVTKIVKKTIDDFLNTPLNTKRVVESKLDLS